MSTLFENFAKLRRYRKSALTVALVGLLGSSANAQLVHRYSFWSATTTNDTVGTANATLYGTATISGGGMTTAGAAGGLSGGVPQNSCGLPSTAVAGITNAFTIESWFLANYNGGFCTMFSLSDGTTANYVLATPARGNSPYASSIAVIGGGGSTTEQQAAEQYQDNGLLHDATVTYDGTNLSYYIDGVLGSYASLPNTISDPGLVLSNLTFIGISGGSPYADNTIKGKTYDFRIFGQALTAAQVATIHGLGTNASNAALAAALVPPTAFVWDGAGANNNWSTGGNWVGGTAPATSGNSIVFAGSTRTSPNLDVNYGVTGLVFSNTASSFTLGAGSSTLTLDGDVINNSANAQTFNVPLALSIPVNINAGAGNLTLNSNVNLGTYALSLTGNNNFTLNGVVSGSGGLAKNGAGTLTIGPSSLTVGNFTLNNGTFNYSGNVTSSGSGVTRIGYLTGNGVANMTGGTWDLGGELQVGGSDQNGSTVIGTGLFNINGGRVNASALTIARGAYLDNNESGTVNLSGGSTFVSTNDVIIQFAGAGFGKLAINNSTFIIAPNATRWFQLGFYDSGSAELDITNGNLLLENSASIKMCRSGNTGGNVINQVGGTVTFYSDAGVTLGGGGNLDLNFAGNSSSSSTYNLIGGILTVPQIVASSVNGVSAFNFNGGTLKPTGSSAAFIQGVSAATVLPGGASIDTTNFNVTIGTTLQDGGGGLTKLGSGTLTLGAGYSYSGPTFVSAGTLSLDAAQNSSSSALMVSNATLTVLLNNGNSSLSAGNIVLKGNSVLNLNFGTAASPSAPAINASGYTVNNTGSTVINIAGQNLTVGQYPLIYTGGSVPTTGFVLGPLPTGVAAHLVNSGSSLDLDITSAGQSLTWYGADTSGNPLTTWNINTSANWNSGTAKYLQYSGNTYGDNVTFDDTLYTADDANITLNTAVVPVSVNFNNNNTTYNITGTGGIGGSTSVAMNGSGVAYLGTANTYTGGTRVMAGTLSVINDAALGAAGKPVTLSGGTLQFSNSTASSRTITVVSNSTIALAAGANIQLSGTISGGANLTESGPGTLSLSGNVTALALTLGATAGDSTLKLSGTLIASNLFVGNISGASAAAAQTGGTANINGGTGDNLGIGNWDGSFGYFNAAGGTMTVNGISIAGEENPNLWPPLGGGDGILEVNGETINNIGWITMARGSGPNSGILNVFSGSLTYSGGGIGCNWNGNATAVTGTQTSIINILGGSVTSTNQGVYFRSTGQTGILNLNGGLLSGTSVGGSGSVNFNGGTLKAAASSGNFLSVNLANVFSKGATIDDGGYAITFSQPLLAPAGYGVSSIALSDGGSGYIAPPIVLISGGTGSNATAIAQIKVATGTITNILVTCPGTGYSSGDSLTVTFSDGGSSAVAPASATASLAANIASGGLTKAGVGTLTLDSVNTFTGPTKVNAGTLAGTGALAGALTNNATLAPGDSGSGSLTVNGNITLTANSTNVFAVNGTTPANASVMAGGNVTYGGVLRIVPSGSFTAGQQFHLFSGAGVASASNFSSIQGSAGSGLGFAFTNGVLSVVTSSTINTNPPQMQVSVTGNMLHLAWPTNSGWILQSNSVGLTATGSWFNYPADGSVGVTSVNITMNPAKTNVFFRMVKP